MWLLLFLTLISYAFGVTPDDRPPVEAKILMNKDMFRKYSADSKPATVRFEITIPKSLAEALGIQLEKHSALRQNQLQESQLTWHRDLKAAPELVNYLIQSSPLRIKYIVGKYYTALIKKGAHVDITPEVNATSSVFKSNFHKHVNILLKENPKNQVDKDLILLDTIDTSSQLLYEGSLICLQMIMDRHFSKKGANVSMVSNDIFKKTLSIKKQDLTLLCNMTRICKPFPGFSEYLVDLLDEVIKLPDSRLHTVVMKTIMIVKNQQDQFIKILGKHLVNLLGERLQIIIYDDLSVIRKTLSVIRKEILERYRWKKSNQTIKAFKILLDMLDTAFVFNETNNVGEYFSITIKALQNWKSGDKNDIVGILKTFYNFVVITLTANWGVDATKEARTLIQFIIDGNIDKQHRYQSLMSHGSNFVKEVL